jgi:hypothetical protein
MLKGRPLDPQIHSQRTAPVTFDFSQTFAVTDKHHRMPYLYNPDIAPDPVTWLEMDEQERIHLAVMYHKKEKISLPNDKVHAAFHAIVENQIAERIPAIANAMTRLAKQGLSRHDCIHAIGSVLAAHLHEMMTSKSNDSTEETNARYAAAVERLDGKAWLQSGAE